MSGGDIEDDNILDNIVDVHGGITFDHPMTDMINESIIPLTAIPDPKTLKNFRVIGFDTVHYGDTKAKWPIEAVKEETLRLMKQIESL